MKCPYILSETQMGSAGNPTFKWLENPDDFSKDCFAIDGVSTTITIRAMTDCLEADCGAWQDGKCRYNR